MKKTKISMGFGVLLWVVLAIACGGGETHKFTGKLETKVRAASDYSEVTSGDDEVEISVTKKSEKEAIFDG